MFSRDKIVIKGGKLKKKIERKHKKMMLRRLHIRLFKNFFKIKKKFLTINKYKNFIDKLMLLKGRGTNRLRFFFLRKVTKRNKLSINNKLIKKINIKNTFGLLIKKLKLEKYLALILKSQVELKLKNFIKASSTSSKFKKIYKEFYRSLILNKVNFFNKQFKEIYAAISLGIYLCRASLISYIFALTIGFGRYRLLKKNLYYLIDVVETLQKVYSSNYSIRINISGKFKGKAKRTQLKYFKTWGIWQIRSLDSHIIDYHVGFVATRTGIFGIKIWLS